jgi:hypothetical protein
MFSILFYQTLQLIIKVRRLQIDKFYNIGPWLITALVASIKNNLAIYQTGFCKWIKSI